MRVSGLPGCHPAVQGARLRAGRCLPSDGTEVRVALLRREGDPGGGLREVVLDVDLLAVGGGARFRAISVLSGCLVGLNPLIQEFLAPLIDAVAYIQVMVHDIVALGTECTQIAGVVRTSRASR